MKENEANIKKLAIMGTPDEIKCLRKENEIYSSTLETITSRANAGNTDEEILMTQLAWDALERVKQGEGLKP